MDNQLNRKNEVRRANVGARRNGFDPQQGNYNTLVGRPAGVVVKISKERLDAILPKLF